MSASSTLGFDPSDYEFRPCPANGSRSPCPALNSLANHGFMFVLFSYKQISASFIPLWRSRDGRNLTFLEVVHAIVLVYNLTYPLAFLLTTTGFITCGHILLWRPLTTTPQGKYNGFLQWPLSLVLLPINVALCFYPRFVLDLSSLSRRGTFKITHDASFVHPDCVPSVVPSTTLLEELLEYSTGRRDQDGASRKGLSLVDIAEFHTRRVELAPSILSNIHRQISLGECALTWEALRGHQCYSGSDDHDKSTCKLKRGIDGVIPVSRIHQWFGEERLPDGWWDVEGVRPKDSVGVIRARFLADLVGELASGTSRKSS